ncbi:MAG: DNA polymerase IV [Clostridiales bacterium]|nr:DNA polymerase IV [Clostridiales bacterium]
MERQILHVDCNKFYASVECFLHPELRGKPVAVGGSEKERHGIILTKNEEAGKYGLVVGEPLWQARQKCPDLIIVEPHFSTYMEFSQKVRRILEDYTDLIEPFGLDEAWIDVTGDWSRNGAEIAREINKRVREEVGITVSVGVSFNKTFAKLGSDYKKPDAVTIISRDNFKDIVWSLPCSALLMAGPSTVKKLAYYGISTIGDLACSSFEFIKSVLGKNGEKLKLGAMGLDTSEVRHMSLEREIKSIGNSSTAPRDLVNDRDVKIVFSVLADSVARRMREHSLKGKVISISVKNKDFESFSRQSCLDAPTDSTSEISEVAFELFRHNYTWEKNVRSLGISVTKFTQGEAVQYDFSGKVERREKMEKLDRAIDKLDVKFGKKCVQRGTVLYDKKLSHCVLGESSVLHTKIF